MLNEFLEFESYVTNPTSLTPRVQPNLLTDHFSESANLIGIEHIMTVIARAFLFSEGRVTPGEVISQQVVDDTIELLQRWTGFSDIDNTKPTSNARVGKWMEQHSVTEGWLKKYWMFQFENGVNEQKKRLSKQELWETLEKKWNERLNSGLDYSANIFTYHNIIANALEIGPLQNHYFIVKKDKKQEGKPVAANKRFKYLSDESRRQESSDMKIMKIVAAYLLRLKYHPKGQKEVWIRNGELANWYGLDDGKNGSETFYPKNVLWQGKPIYTRHILRGNYTKISIDQEYLKTFDFKIINIEDVDQYKETHWVLEDLGHKLVGCWDIR
ncbi:MAG: hypothetical protein U0K86_07470 [Agathobacter sp.]|nr:hypothetical protein [Agathobacter sp.]